MHCCLINDYMDIINEQMNLILKSGLYSRIDKVYIGCLGDKSDYNRLKSFISPFPKFEIYAYDTDIKKYEFHTLKIVQEISLVNPKFYGFYIHTKGVNYPGNIGGKYWLDYMNYYNLIQWKEAVRHLDIGYYTYGVKLLPSTHPPAFKMHYSGNFWWFNSEYISTLPDIDSLDKCNRYNAEVWICLEQPIAATACQLFVDYTAIGLFEPFKNVDNI